VFANDPDIEKMMMYTINEFVVIFYLCKMLFVSTIKRCNFNTFRFL